MSDFEERARKAAGALHEALDDAGLKADDGERTAKRRTVKSKAAVAGTSVVAVVAMIAGIGAYSADKVLPPFDGGTGSPTFSLAGALKPFNQCEDALSYFRANAADFYLKQNRGISTMEQYDSPSDSLVSGPATKSDSMAATAGAPVPAAPTQNAAPQFSTTNVAEAGVDEPDVTKTDGRMIVTVTNGQVRLLHANNGDPKLATTLSDNSVRNVLLNGNRLVLFESTTQYNTFDMPYGYATGANNVGSKSTVAIYDVTNIDKPSLVSSIDITGSIVDARMVGNQISLVTNYLPDIDVLPQYGPNGQISDSSKQQLQDAVAQRAITQWLPTYTLHDGRHATVGSGQLVDCNNVGHPDKFSGISTTSLVTFDLTDTLAKRHAAGVIASGNQVYANASHLFVTSTDFGSFDHPANTTSIHEFTTRNDGTVAYDGSGNVDGTLLNEYSMSEWDGSLRVATTVTSQGGWLSRHITNEGKLTVLQLKDDTLKEVGSVAGLGADDNETVGSVRFIGARGYVTTSRITDPLYVLDLSKPNTPSVSGQLHVPGSSAYLHPINDNLLFSVGNADPSKPSLQAALYDVSDASNPRQIATQNYGTSSGGQFDPKAFLYWAPRNLIVLPINVMGQLNKDGVSNRSGTWSGLVLLNPTANGLTEVGRLQDVNSTSFDLLRTFVIDSDVYELSNSALQVNSLDTHKETARLKLS